MGRLLLSITVLALAGMSAPAAYAQNQAATKPGQMEDEFKEFRQKMQSAKGGAPTAAPNGDTTPVATISPETAAPALAGKSAAAAPAVPAGLPAAPAPAPADSGAPAFPEGVTSDPAAAGAMADPLGPGGTLPLSGNMPVGGFVPPQLSAEEMKARNEEDLAAQQKKIDEQTFDAALKQLLPLKATDMRRTLDSFKERREAAETPIAMPEPKQVVETVSLDPSDAPSIIHTAPGYVTTVTILDATGAPWPIQDMTWAGKFDIMAPEEGGHVLRITPQSAHGVGNISLRLVDLVTPLSISLRTGLDEVYYRFDARIPKNGPLAKTPIIEYGGLKAVAGKDDQMAGILDGTPPAGAVKMKIDGADGRTSAWKISDRLYLRTPLTMLSPGWDSSMASADGMNVYTLGATPVILLSDEGRMVRAHIAEDEVTP